MLLLPHQSWRPCTVETRLSGLPLVPAQQQFRLEPWLVQSRVRFVSPVRHHLRLLSLLSQLHRPWLAVTSSHVDHDDNIASINFTQSHRYWIPVALSLASKDSEERVILLQYFIYGIDQDQEGNEGDDSLIVDQWNSGLHAILEQYLRSPSSNILFCVCSWSDHIFSSNCHSVCSGSFYYRRHFFLTPVSFRSSHSPVEFRQQSCLSTACLLFVHQKIRECNVAGPRQTLLVCLCVARNVTTNSGQSSTVMYTIRDETLPIISVVNFNNCY